MKRVSVWIAWLAAVGVVGMAFSGPVLAQNTDTPSGLVNADASESGESGVDAAETSASEAVSEEASPEPAETGAEPESIDVEAVPETALPGDAAAGSETKPEEGGEAAQAPEPAAPVEPAPPATDYSGVWQALDDIENTMSGAVRTALTAPQLPTTLAPQLAPTLPPQVAPRPVAGAPSAPPAPQEPRDSRTSGAVTVFGRPGQAGIIDQDGTMQPYSLREIALRNQPDYRLSDLPQYEGRPGTKQKPGEIGRRLTPFPMGEPGEEETTPETATGEPTGEAEAQPEENVEEPLVQEGNGKPSAKPQDTGTQPAESAGADEEAARQQALAEKNADIERIRQLRQDGAWFYNSDGTQMTREQLEARLMSGDIENIKAVDRYQTSWTAKDSYDPPETAAPAQQ